MTAQEQPDDLILVRVDASAGRPEASVAVTASKHIPDVDAETHGGRGEIPDGVAEELGMRVEEFVQQWAPLVKSLRHVFQLTDDETQTDGFHVDTVKVGLGVNANGKLFLVGNVGAKASVEVTFRRHAATA
ncbi:MAG: hypothetical protein OXG82_16875 [Gammaproteobacteria bacterium]|nr:hypothetical protein [Gammaproteobacteria bacterium]